MKTDKILLYILETILLIISLCFIFFADIFARSIISIVLLIFACIFYKVVKTGKVEGRYNRKITTATMLIGIIYVVVMYIIGIYVGFYKSTVYLSLWSIKTYIIPYIVIIVSTEIIRKKILLKNDKKSKAIILLITIMIDVAVRANIKTVKTLNDYFTFFGYVLFSSIAENLLFNYITSKYRNSKAVIGYRLITILYPYVIPITPDIHILFESVLGMIVPYVIYLILEKNYSKKEVKFSTTKKTTDILVTSTLVILTVSILMLVSCKFKYGALVIASGSMTGTINKGDVIIYEKLDEDEEINVGNIIVFKKDNMRVIHRVIEKKNSGANDRYYTKGDANQNQDEGYREIEDIIGKVKLRIPYIGQLTVFINEIFD